MIYKNIKQGKFIDRPNRFIANIEIDGQVEVCHVKNTGRCSEILINNATVFVQEWDKPERKTKFDLISAYKGDRLINIDSQAPNKVFYEFLLEGNLFEDITYIKSEMKYNHSRFDFYIETKTDKIFLEVKGVTLEKNDIVLFPDAPTERGVKHIYELIECVKNGYQAYVIFVVQMKDVRYFMPNAETHKEFAQALKEAEEQGVHILAYDCVVTKDSMKIADPVEVKI